GVIAPQSHQHSLRQRGIRDRQRALHDVRCSSTVAMPRLPHPAERTMTSIRSTLGGAALIAVVVLLGCAACSSNKSSSSSTNTASQQVCDARSEFSSAVSKVGDDLRSFNLGDARSDAQTVQSTFSTLMDAVNHLTQQQRQQLQPQIDQIKSDLSSF